MCFCKSCCSTIAHQACTHTLPSSSVVIIHTQTSASGDVPRRLCVQSKSLHQSATAQGLVLTLPQYYEFLDLFRLSPPSSLQSKMNTALGRG